MFEGVVIRMPFSFFTVQFLANLYPAAVGIYVFSILGFSLKRLTPLFIVSALIGIIPMYLGWMYYHYTPEQQETFFNQLVFGPYPDSVTFYSVTFYSAQQIVFIWLVFKLRSVKRRVKQFQSDIDKTKLSYLQRFVLMLLVLNFFIVTLYVTFDILFVEYILLPLIVGTIYTFITFNAFRNNAIFDREDFLIQVELNLEKMVVIEEESVEIEDFQAYVNTLTRSMDEEQVFKIHDLTIQQLSEKTGIPTANLSKTINHHFKVNFFDFINQRRIEEAKHLLKAKSHKMTMEWIGFEAGFSSRASFYRAFKKYTNTTPKAYVEGLNES